MSHPHRGPGFLLWLSRLAVLLLLGYILLACAPSAAAPTAVPEEELSLVISIPNGPSTLDAHAATGSGESDIMDFIGATLVGLDAKGEIVPYLAESWKQSEDGLTWTFTLKSGITFQDGTPFTAQDYVYTFDRARNPELGGAAAEFLGPVISYLAPNDTTLEITLAEPFFPFLRNLGFAHLMPLSQAEVERQGEAYGRHPMSVGPYRLTEWRDDDTIVLERNPDFHWGPTYAPQEEYALDRVEFRVIPDPSDQLVALEAGEIDLLQLDPLHMRQTQPLLGEYNILEYVLAGAAPMGAFNVQAAPVDDERVRQAINLAVDREGVLQAVARGEGEAQCGPLSSSVAGYWSGVEDFGCDFDVERAEALLEEAGYVQREDGAMARDGEPLVLSIIATPDHKATAEFIKEQLGEVGVQVEVETPENFGERLFSGEYNLALFDIIYSEADILYLLYHSTDFLFPVSHSTNAELDALLEQTRSLQDPEARQEAVNQAQQYIMEHAYMLPLYTPRRQVAVSQDIKGLLLRPDGSILYEGISHGP
ncbi:MAG: ABC transporter substrate-binding protein [Ardenticatenales bacterium]|nr:ABC transporter substrate-binding protein [Ardenticatenales bacterium]